MTPILDLTEAGNKIRYGVCEECGFSLGPFGGLEWKATQMTTEVDGNLLTFNPNTHNCFLSQYLYESTKR